MRQALLAAYYTAQVIGNLSAIDRRSCYVSATSSRIVESTGGSMPFDGVQPGQDAATAPYFQVSRWNKGRGKRR